MNVDLRLLKLEIEKEIRNIAHREEFLRSQLSSLSSVVNFLYENHRIRERCNAGSGDGRRDFVDYGSDSRFPGKTSGIRICPRCEVKVLPTKDGRCPSCQIEFSVR